MGSSNCWEAKGCGLEPGGRWTGERGVCPAALSGPFDGLNGGWCAGRSCWMVPGTKCGDGVHGAMPEKLKSCLSCEFMDRVTGEQGREFVLMPPFRARVDEYA